ncbi:carboxylesterase family protein [Crossiella sp. CA-258035]|uniref:carboxylesterase/lipase family protein n=1 Tax=Crossiella sp. CA-258035 TaxID=2981138 RepID=UPI0024BCF508|nr:carboxylesterase family protein [Crossiella sp. CA-258035]WHT15900.1 carboxylesterase family protein [Crossiella sp. CA-258035]
MAEVDRRTALGLAGGAALAAALPGTAAAASGDDSDVLARTPLGKLRGVRQDGITVWRGIRYAEAPTGEHRFTAPRPVRPWRGVRAATEFGPVAHQLAGPPRPPGPQSEDCLFLNVYSRGTQGCRPVVVWIHGGVFISGAGSDYDGTVFAERNDVVLVTINYRLHAFGFLHLPGRPGSGNTGLLDQVEALRWVRRCIGAFGGDPRNVTVMGESAGGMSIGSLLGAPAAAGLFRRAVTQSGGARPHFTPAQAQRTTDFVLKRLGIPSPDSPKLFTVPAADVVAAAAEASTAPELGGEVFHQVLDGHVLPVHPLRRISAKVDVLIGTCRDESNQLAGIFPMFVPGMENKLRSVAGADRFAAIQAAYREHTPAGRDPRLDLASDIFVQLPSIWLAEAVHRAGGRAWAYRFDYAHASPLGPVHASDLPFTFGKADPQRLHPQADRQVADRLARQLNDSLSAFARTGDPRLPKLPRWRPFDPADRHTLLFAEHPSISNDRVSAELRAAWAGVPPTAF